MVIGKTGNNIPEAEVMDHIGGYCIALDMTNATMMNLATNIGLAWCLSKGFDTSCPVGDFVPKDKIPDPQNVQLWLKQNGVSRQDANTNDMVHGIAYIIHYVSQYVTLERGDLILTGTPGGIRNVQPGDRLDAGLADITQCTFYVE